MTDTKQHGERVAKETPDLLEGRIKELKELFPDAVSEGKIDWMKLRAALGEDVEIAPERYSFAWAGKRDAIRMLQTPSRATLVPAKDESLDFDATENIFIEGDNLEVLKLLYKPYFGRVKMIYIDPPYNTGNDFVYPDNYADPLDTYLKITGQKDNDGNLLTSNPETSGRYHSAWLSMMYPRLFLARQLLTEDGVIFVTIDDTEISNLRSIMNEIYGEENFVSNVVWHKKRGKDNSAQFLSQVHDYVVIYARNLKSLTFRRLELDARTRRAYRNPDGDNRGDYRVLGLWSRGGQGGSRYSFATKEGKHFSKREWLVGEVKMRDYDKDNRLIVVGDKLYRKLFIWENEGAIPETIWTDASNNANAADELKAIFDGTAPFDTPKPVPLLKRMAQLSTSKNDLILDFFAGSCTTAQAMLELNREDGGNRRFIMVQLPEPLPHPIPLPKGEGAMRSIADIGKERIRRVIAKMQNDSAGKLDLKDRDTPEDLGFKVFKLTPSNFKQWSGTTDKDAQAYTTQLAMLGDPLADGWKIENVICEVAVKEGFGLNCRIEKIKGIKSNTVYRVTDPDKEQAFFICLDETLRLDAVKDLELNRERMFICRDRALDDDAAANLALQCRLKTI